MNERREEINVIVANSKDEKFEIETISPHLRLLLRAAYMASCMYAFNTFPHGQKQDFKELEMRNWPIEIPKKNRSEETTALIKKIDERFESRVLTDTRYFIDNQDKQINAYELISKAVKLPGDKKKLIQAWHGKEIEEIYNKKKKSEVGKLRNK